MKAFVCNLLCDQMFSEANLSLVKKGYSSSSLKKTVTACWLYQMCLYASFNQLHQFTTYHALSPWLVLYSPFALHWMKQDSVAKNAMACPTA